MLKDLWNRFRGVHTEKPIPPPLVAYQGANWEAQHKKPVYEPNYATSIDWYRSTSTQQYGFYSVSGFPDFSVRNSSPKRRHSNTDDTGAAYNVFTDPLSSLNPISPLNVDPSPSSFDFGGGSDSGAGASRDF